MRCYYKDCDKNPTLECKCQPKKVVFCEMHRQVHIHEFHLNVPKNGLYAIKPLQFSEYEEAKRILNYYDTFSALLIKDAHKAIETIQQNLSRFISEINQQKSILHQCIRSRVSLKNLEIIKLFPDVFKITKKSSKSLLSSISDYFDMSILTINGSPKRIGSLLSMRSCIPIIQDSDRKTLLVLDTANLKIKSFKFPKLTLPYFPHIQETDENIFVFFGGMIDRKINGNLFIVDFNTITITDLPAAQPRWAGGVAFKTQSVYFFGGYMETDSKSHQIGVTENCIRYDVVQRYWRRIAELPKKSTRNSAAVVKDRIIVLCGSLKSLYIYEEAKDTFKQFLMVGESKHKVICDRYVLCRDLASVYEIVDDQLMQYVIESQWNAKIELQTSGFKRGEYLFWLEHSVDCPKVFRFDIQQKLFKAIEINNSESL